MTTSLDKNKGNILYFQSGGPTTVINATFLGLFEAYLKKNNGEKFYVSRYGISSLIEDKLTLVKKDSFPALSYRPGSYWGSLRMKLPKDSKDPIVVKIMEVLKKRNIHYVFVNGGNDSMNTAYRLWQYAKEYAMDIQVMGVPKTVDNDLYGCDHTPGFGSAAKYVANAVLSIALDDKTYEKGRVNIVECMGRDSGFLTAAAVLTSLRGEKPDYIFVPEVPFDCDEFISKVKKTFEEKGRCLVVVSEGIKNKEGELIASDSVAKDSFNHPQVGGVCKYLAALLDEQGIKNRGIELSVIQRASGFIPSLTDVREAKRVAALAYQKAMKGKTGYMIAIQRKEGKQYHPYFTMVPLNQVADEVVYLPKKYINSTGDNINENYIDFVLPLIKGNANALDKDGLLKY